MRSCIVSALAITVLTSTGLLSAGVVYRERFGTSLPRYDYPRDPDGEWSRFFSTLYTPGPFDENESTDFTVYVQGHRMARVGPFGSTIYDLDAATVSVTQKLSRQVAVLTFDEYLEWTRRNTIHKRHMGATAEPTNDTDYVATIYAGGQGNENIVAHVGFRRESEFPNPELREYVTYCLQKYGTRYAGICSLTNPLGFGYVAEELATVPAFISEEVVEWRLRSPASLGHQPFAPQIPVLSQPASSDRWSANDPHAPWHVEAGPGLGQIARAESHISDVKKQAVDESVFAVPSGYKRIKHVR